VKEPEMDPAGIVNDEGETDRTDEELLESVTVIAASNGVERIIVPVELAPRLREELDRVIPSLPSVMLNALLVRDGAFVDVASSL
jgi:hypothetical protein